MQIASAKSWSASGASHQPALMGNFLTIIVIRACPVYLANELVLVFYAPL